LPLSVALLLFLQALSFSNSLKSLEEVIRILNFSIKPGVREGRIKYFFSQQEPYTGGNRTLKG